MQKPKIILASQSIGRRQLLEKLGVPFDIVHSSIDEAAIFHADPIEKLMIRARAKAENVMKKLSNKYQLSNYPISNNSPKSYQLQATSFLIFAADSEAILDGKTYGKAKDKTHAKEIIGSLMGKTHEFVTATHIILSHLSNLSRWETTTSTKVSLRILTPEALNHYVNRYDFSRFAAGYALNETPWDLVTKIEGSYTNVIGLPFEVVLPIFQKLDLF